MDNNVILEMLIGQKELIKSLDKKISTQQDTSSQLDVEKFEQLAGQMQDNNTSTTEAISKMSEVIEQARQPIIKQHKFTVDIVSKSAFSLFMGMTISILILSISLFKALEPNFAHRDNDLKYRYIKMKGEATAEEIAELENIFESNRDNTKIRQMHKDVDKYEETIRKQTILKEQARLKQLEIESLGNEVKLIKERK